MDTATGIDAISENFADPADKNGISGPLKQRSTNKKPAGETEMMQINEASVERSVEGTMARK